MRRAAKTDACQREIVSALRAIGAHVTYIKEPVDLVVGFRRRTILLECKDAKTGRLTKSQETFFATFAGEAYIVQSAGEAIKAVLGAKGPIGPKPAPLDRGQEPF